MKHLSNWIEIPVLDMQRAVLFYQSIFGDLAFVPMEIGEIKYSIFPSQDPFNNGALVQSPAYIPSQDGIIVYLDGGKDLDIILQKVSLNGGTIIMKKTYLSNEAGYVGMFIDSEGNKIGLQHP